MEQVVTHYGETIQQHSVEWYKKQLLKDWSVEFIKDSLLPQLFEWSNAYKAAVELTNKNKRDFKMTNKQIETILTKAIETAYSKQSEEISKKLGAVEDAVQSAIDGIDYNEVKGMTEKEAYIFYYEWALVRIMSAL